jgi:putative hemolysin
MVEVGRSCVHADYRTGATIALLWAGLADYMAKNGYEYLAGCASISMADGGHMAASLYEEMKSRVMSPVEWRVFPRCPLPLDALDRKRDVEIPPLIRGYLRAGAYVCGDPAWDLFILLPMSRINARYKRHFIEAA